MNMVQIGLIKYDKDEEAILGRSFLLGMFVGIPLSILINYFYGFPTFPRQPSYGLLGWAATFFTLFMSFLIIPYIVTITFLVLFLREKEKADSARHFYRAFWALLVLLVLIPLYVAVTSALLVPLWSLASELSGGRWFMTLTSLAELPFVALLLAIILPDSRPGKALRRLRSNAQKEQR